MLLSLPVMRLILSAFVALTLPLSAVAQPLSADEQAKIEAVVKKKLDETGVPSASVAVVRGGELVFTGAWGKASETIAQTRPDLPYQIASNSKQFLAALMLMLENDGKLNLNDTVESWLPGMVTDGRRISLRQLLNHTSGLQDFWPQDYSFKAMEQPATPERIVAEWGRKPLDYTPGTRWQYSNTGYVVAGLIAEKAGGKPLADQLQERIFAPLNMHPIMIDDSNGPAFPQGYHRNALGPVRAAKPAAPGWLYAAGELSMTAADLARWDIARLDRKLLPPEDWAEMERATILPDGTTNGYGLGLSGGRMKGRNFYNHGGESVGFLSQNTIWPDADAAVVVLTNADFAGVQDELTGDIADIVLPKSDQLDSGETARADEAHAVYDSLVAGKADLSRFTDNARYYFNPTTLEDYHSSLLPLGTPTKFEAVRTPRLRGGFVNRNFRITYPNRTLMLVTYAEPGATGRWEQFIVMPE